MATEEQMKKHKEDCAPPPVDEMRGVGGRYRRSGPGAPRVRVHQGTLAPGEDREPGEKPVPLVVVESDDSGPPQDND